MSRRRFDVDPQPAPDFPRARTRHQKARSTGMHPDYWYPVEYSRRVRTGQAVEVTFWKRSIAVFRGADGAVRAIDDRCAHRQLKLSAGRVDGCNLVCLYHGWGHDGEGRVVDIPHDLFGRGMPNFRVQHYPVRERYGLVWIFPGDPALAAVRDVPAIPELEDSTDWLCSPVDALWQGHHSMIIDNVSDFTHAYLHRKYKPFSNAELTALESRDDKVFVSYRSNVGGSRMAALFTSPDADTGHIDLCYDYPYQRSNTGGMVKHWCFVLPIDERQTRCFFLFLFHRDFIRMPALPGRMPRPALAMFLRLLRQVYTRPLLDQDRVAIEAEQRGHDEYHDAPIPELNPAVKEFQRLTVAKWEEYLATRGGAQASARHQ